MPTYEVLVNCLETTTTAGTGAYSLLGAPYGRQTFFRASGDATGGTCIYKCEDVDPIAQTGSWELGIGTLSASSTLDRTTILATSNGDTTKISWPSSGVRAIYSTWPGSSGVLLGAANLETLENIATARTNLGLGDAALKDEGSGNGLDADLLDGLHASSFVQLSGSQTITAAKTFSGDMTLQGDFTFSNQNDFSGGELILPVGNNKWSV